MVCIYCGGSTRVVNSRLQKTLNQVWRRRRCLSCGAVFTTQEAVELTTSLVVRHPSGRLLPFQREKLLLSVYESCKHRPTATADAVALTQTIVSKLLPLQQEGLLNKQDILQLTYATLNRFDPTAATLYRAYNFA